MQISDFCTRRTFWLRIYRKSARVVTDVVMGFRLVGSQMSGLFGHVSKSLKNAKLRNNEKFWGGLDWNKKVLYIKKFKFIKKKCKNVCLCCSIFAKWHPICIQLESFISLESTILSDGCFLWRTRTETKDIVSLCQHYFFCTLRTLADIRTEDAKYHGSNLNWTNWTKEASLVFVAGAALRHACCPFAWQVLGFGSTMPG